MGDDFFMRRFFLLLFIIVALSFALLFSQVSLFGLLGVRTDVVTTKASETDLGFVIEEKCENSIRYFRGNDIVGECVEVNSLSLSDISRKLGLTVTNKYSSEGRTVIEGISSLCKFYVKGRKENVMIAITGDRITVASPIIYGSF